MHHRVRTAEVEASLMAESVGVGLAAEMDSGWAGALGYASVMVVGWDWVAQAAVGLVAAAGLGLEEAAGLG